MSVLITAAKSVTSSISVGQTFLKATLEAFFLDKYLQDLLENLQ